MIFRFSDKNDISAIISLWNEAFGDSEKEIRFFLDNKYIPENTLIIEENGEIASMLFLLEGNMVINGKRFPSYYLYAACTANRYRGRGLMAFLLEKANETARLRNKDFICLMPGEKSLFDFYGKHGYKTVFSKKIVTIKRDSFNLQPINKKTDKINFEKLRNIAFSDFDFFEWDNSSVEFASAHNEMYHGKTVLSRKGYYLYGESDDICIVKEFAFAEEDFIYGFNLLLNYSECGIIKITLPSQYKTEIGECSVFPSAMIYPLNREAAAVTASLENAYLGLTLD